MVGKYKVITLCGSTRFKKQFLEIVGIYNHIHEQETRVEVTIGWNPTIYPVRQTATASTNVHAGCTQALAIVRQALYLAFSMESLM